MGLREILAYRKVKKDFEQVVRIVWDRFFLFGPVEEIDGRSSCHEFAYLINFGMRQRGYDSSVRSGVYNEQVWHSWVEVNGFILDFQWENNTGFNGTYEVVHDGEKRRFRETSLPYELSLRIEEVAQRIFS